MPPESAGATPNVDPTATPGAAPGAPGTASADGTTPPTGSPSGTPPADVSAGAPAATPPAAGGDATPPGEGAPTGPASLAEVAPENWRDLISKGDAKRANVLNRFASIDVLAESFFEAQERLRKGEAAAPLPENPTEEQLANYRERNGIPAAPDAYVEALPQGLVLGDEDRNALNPLLAVAHANHIPAKAMAALTEAYVQNRQAEQEAFVQRDGSDRIATETTLKRAWGADYQTNINYTKALLAQMPEETRELFVSARLPDGTAVFNNPEIMVFFANAARQAMPAASLVPTNDPTPMKTLEGRKAELEKMMGSDDWHSNKDAQREYMQIIDALKGLRAQQV